MLKQGDSSIRREEKGDQRIGKLDRATKEKERAEDDLIKTYNRFQSLSLSSASRKTVKKAAKELKQAWDHLEYTDLKLKDREALLAQDESQLSSILQDERAEEEDVTDSDQPMTAILGKRKIRKALLPPGKRTDLGNESMVSKKNSASIPSNNARTIFDLTMDSD